MESPSSASDSEIQQLKARVKELETALRQSHKSTSSDSHPLLAQEPIFPIEDSSSSDPDDGLTKSFGTLTIEEDSGRTQWYGYVHFNMPQRRSSTSMQSNCCVRTLSEYGRTESPASSPTCRQFTRSRVNRTWKNVFAIHDGV